MAELLAYCLLGHTCNVKIVHFDRVGFAMNVNEKMGDNSIPTGSQTWRELVHAALLELDSKQLAVKIEIARNAIRQRIAELESSGAYEGDERSALRDGMNSIRTLENILRHP